MNKYRILRLTGAAHGAVEAFINDGGELPYTSTNRVVTMALATAFLAHANVELEAFGGDSRVIRRIAPFDVPEVTPVPNGRISRLATQRNGQFGISWLEVFIRTGPDTEVAYNVPDESVQQLCHVAAISRGHFEFDYDGNELTAIRLKGTPA